MLDAREWNFTKRPWEPRKSKPEAKPPRWYQKLLDLPKGDSMTIYERRAAGTVKELAALNNIPYEVRKLRGGGWRFTKG